jgi:fatty-acyl-CoA synthase
MVPAIMKACLDHPAWADTDISCLRMLSAGSSTIPHALLRGFQDRGVPVVQVYGSTETAPVAATLPPADAVRKIGSTGKAVLHCDIRVVDDGDADVAPGVPGEILVRGPNVMREYWNNPDATAEALAGGWFHSGDVGHFDEDGFLYIDERKSDLIISGGENIYPAELENVLADCPQLAESAVVGRDDPKWGQVPVAVVVPKDKDAADRDAVLALFADRLARYKHPHDVVFVNHLPRNAMGKVLRYELRALVKRT